MRFEMLTKDRESLGFIEAENLDIALTLARASKDGLLVSRLEIQTYQQEAPERSESQDAQMKSAGNAVAAYSLWLSRRRSISVFGGGNTRSESSAWELASVFCKVMGCTMPSKTAADTSFEQIARKYLNMD